MDGLKKTGYVGGVLAIKKARMTEARKEPRSEKPQHKQNKPKKDPEDEHVVDEYV